MPLPRARGCLGAAGALLLGIVALAVWAVAGTLGLDGPPVPPAPGGLSDAPGEFGLEAEPLTARIDQPITIRVTGLPAGEEVILRASSQDAEGVTFTSWARFVADEEGIADSAHAAPLEGTWEGIDPSGLLWSMVAPGDALFYTSSKWETREVSLRAETSAGFREIKLERRYPWPETEREEVQGPGFVGELSYRKSLSPLPVILLLGGWGDGPSPLTAALLADEGYAVLNVGYHHWEGAPEDLVEIPVETVTAALDWIEADDRLDGERIGVYGTSKGAELALLAASHDPRLKAVAAWAPSSVVFSGIDFRDPAPGSSWTLEGRPLPYAESQLGLVEIRNSLRFLLRRPMILRESYEKGLAAAPAEAFLRVEHIQGPVLLVSGTDDQLWPSSVMAEQVADRLRSRGPDQEVENLIFAGAGHGITFSLWPRGGRRTGIFHRGGTAALDHRAGQTAWTTMLEFFARRLKPSPGGSVATHLTEAPLRP